MSLDQLFIYLSVYFGMDSSSRDTISTSARSSELQTSVVSNLQDAGFFYDPLEAEVTNEFMPWLMESMTEKLDMVTVARQIADDLAA